MKRGLTRLLGNISAVTALCSAVYVKLNNSINTESNIDTVMLASVIILALVYFGTIEPANENAEHKTKEKNQVSSKRTRKK